MSDEDDILDDLLGQLKDNNAFNNQALKSNKQFKLPKEQLEEFILNTSGRLVQDSLDMIEIVKERVAGAAEPDDVASLSELFKASTNTVEALNKILIQDKRTLTTLTAKQMDIDSRQQIAEKAADTAKIIASREEIVNKLFKKADVIDVQPEED
jgi:DNA-binding protein